MRYLHQVTDNKGEVIEAQYSSTKETKLSLECSLKIHKGAYIIWDRNNNWKLVNKIK